MYLGDREQLEGSQEGLLMLIKLKKVRINNNEYIRVFETGWGIARYTWAIVAMVFIKCSTVLEQQM